MNYYNEFDAKAAAWLRQLIADGLIPQGEVDERSIVDVAPADLAGFTQCHFFAGIGGWPLALDLAGWDRSRPVWTGSCPCQPFSQAGKQKGQADERHLWPEFHRLIKACRPQTVFGEQVASSEVVGTQLETDFLVAVQSGQYARANKLARKLARSHSLHYHRRWVDGIRSDLEAEDYAFGSAILGAHSVRSPHIRQRLFWVADGIGERHEAVQRDGDAVLYRNGTVLGALSGLECGGPVGRMADSGHRDDRGEGRGEPAGRAIACGADGGLVQPIGTGLEGHAGDGDDRSEPGRHGAGAGGSVAAACRGNALGLADARGGTGERGAGGLPAAEAGIGGTGQLNGDHALGLADGRQDNAWGDYDLVPCRDGKARRIKRGLAALVDGLPAGVVRGGDPSTPINADYTAEARVMRLRGYGNAIVPKLAAEFISAFMETQGVDQ